MEKNRAQDKFHLCAEKIAITKLTWKFPTLLLSNKDELAMAKTDADKFSEVMKVKDDEITFLRGHVK
jgi:hypothetical protein